MLPKLLGVEERAVRAAAMWRGDIFAQPLRKEGTVD